jgi:hypothetical protein
MYLPIVLGDVYMDSLVVDFVQFSVESPGRIRRYKLLVSVRL